MALFNVSCFAVDEEIEANSAEEACDIYLQSLQPEAELIEDDGDEEEDEEDDDYEE